MTHNVFLPSRSFRAAAALCTALLLTSACASGPEPVPESEGAFELNLDALGKADGAGVLSPEDAQRIADALQDVIDAGEAAIESLEADISEAEDQHAATLSQIERLVQQIQDRREELEDQLQRNLIICVLTSNPSLCSIAVLMDNDSRMQSYKADLAAAEERLLSAQESMSEYEEDRDTLRSEIDGVRANRDALLAAVAGVVAVSPLPEGIVPGSDAAVAFMQLDILEDLSRLTEEEVELLRELRNSALLLQAELDDALVVIEQLAISIEGNIDGARDRFFGALDALVTGTSERLATEYLERQVAERTRSILENAGWPAGPFIDFIVDGRADEEELREALLQQIVTPASAHAATVRFSFEDACDDGESTRLRIHGVDSDRAWPSEDLWRLIEDEGPDAVVEVTCAAGEKVCYGASTAGGKDWGVGVDYTFGCEACCWTCTDMEISRRLVCD